MTEALMFTIAAGEREMEKFEGKPTAIAEALKVAVPIGQRNPECVDEELAEALK